MCGIIGGGMCMWCDIIGPDADDDDDDDGDGPPGDDVGAGDDDGIGGSR